MLSYIHSLVAMVYPTYGLLADNYNYFHEKRFEEMLIPSLAAVHNAMSGYKRNHKKRINGH